MFLSLDPVALIQQRKKYILGILTVLYITVILDLVAGWRVLRLTTVLHDETRDSIIFEYLSGSAVLRMKRMASGTSVFAAMIADGLLVSIPSCPISHR